MAGLLEGYTGENTVKDEFGQTQADRRDPIWSGLIKAGLLAVAGGSNIMPEQRAKYLAEAGGAIGDIPNQMVANRSAAAQNVLRSQQLDEGKRKVADRDRIRAYAQTPEMQEIIKNAKGADKIAIQAAIDTGDIGALNTAVGNLDKSGLNAEKLAIQQGRLDLAKDKLENAKGRSYLGTGIEAQHHDNLKNAPVNSYEYWAAHQFFSTEQKRPDGGTIGKIDLSRLPVPTYVDPRTGKPPDPNEPPKPPEVKPDTPMTPEVVQGIGKDMKVNEEKVVNGVTISKDAEGSLSWDTGTETKEGNRYKVGPKGVETLPPLKPPSSEQMKTFGNETAITKIEETLADMAKYPNMTLGVLAAQPDAMLQRNDPDGNRARSHISDLGSVIIHDRSGAAVSATEMARLNFIPRTTDSPPEIKRKLEAMKQFLEAETRAAYETVGRDTRLPSNVKKRYGGKPAAAAPPATAAKGTTPIGKGDQGQPLYRWSDGKVYESPEP